MLTSSGNIVMMTIYFWNYSTYEGVALFLTSIGNQNCLTVIIGFSLLLQQKTNRLGGILFKSFFCMFLNYWKRWKLLTITMTSAWSEWLASAYWNKCFVRFVVAKGNIPLMLTNFNFNLLKQLRILPFRIALT